MKPQFLHEATSSFVLWFDNYLLTKGEAYANRTGSLTYSSDDILGSSYNPYSSPYKQWVGDASISGATIANSIFVDGVEKNRGTDGLRVDYRNGRAVFDSTVSTSSSVTGSFSVKDFNIYITDQDEEDLITESKFDINTRFSTSEVPIAPYKQVVPAAFISCQESKNTPHAFGGEDRTSLDFRCVFISDDMYKLDGALSIFNDSNDVVFSQIDYDNFPETEFGDNKYGSYNYNDLEALSTEKFFITDVTSSKLSDKVSKKVLPNLFVGFVDFEVAKYRFPRQ
jgi:hypothetical protein